MVVYCKSMQTDIQQISAREIQMTTSKNVSKRLFPVKERVTNRFNCM